MPGASPGQLVLCRYVIKHKSEAWDLLDNETEIEQKKTGCLCEYYVSEGVNNAKLGFYNAGFSLASPRLSHRFISEEFLYK